MTTEELQTRMLREIVALPHTLVYAVDSSRDAPKRVEIVFGITPLTFTYSKQLGASFLPESTGLTLKRSNAFWIKENVSLSEAFDGLQARVTETLQQLEAI